MTMALSLAACPGRRRRARTVWHTGAQPSVARGANDALLNPMSKSNVNPNHYKVAGRERQGEDILQERHKQKLAESLTRQRFDSRPPYIGPGREVFAPEASAEPGPEPSTKQVRPIKQTARKKPARARGLAKVAARHATKPRAKSRAPVPRTRRATTKAQASAKTGKRTAGQKRASSRNDVESKAGGPRQSRSAEEKAVHRAPRETVTVGFNGHGDRSVVRRGH